MNMPMPNERIDRLEVLVYERERRSMLRTIAFMATPVVALAVLAWVVIARLDGMDDRVAQALGRLQQVEQSREAVGSELVERERALADLQAERDRALAELADQRKAAADAIERAHGEVKAAQTRMQQLEQALARMEDQLGRSAGVAQAVREVDWASEGFIARRPRDVGKILREIAEYRALGTGWGLGNSVEQGFLSDGFAGFILQQLGILPAGEEAARALAALERGDEEPREGDIVLYAGGYAMFFVRDAAGEPFVLGMTPAGIAALEPDFGIEREGVLAVPLVDRSIPEPPVAEAPPAPAPGPEAPAPAAPAGTTVAAALPSGAPPAAEPNPQAAVPLASGTSAAEAAPQPDSTEPAPIPAMPAEPAAEIASTPPGAAGAAPGETPATGEATAVAPAAEIPPEPPAARAETEDPNARFIGIPPRLPPRQRL